MIESKVICEGTAQLQKAVDPLDAEGVAFDNDADLVSFAEAQFLQQLGGYGDGVRVGALDDNSHDCPALWSRCGGYFEVILPRHPIWSKWYALGSPRNGPRSPRPTENIADRRIS